MEIEISGAGVLKFLRLSILLFVVSFAALWATWALFPALAVVGLMGVAWLLGALFAIAIIPSDAYSQYVRSYREKVDPDEK